jgi:hypothetical protein
MESVKKMFVPEASFTSQTPPGVGRIMNLWRQC